MENVHSSVIVILHCCGFIILNLHYFFAFNIFCWEMRETSKQKSVICLFMKIMFGNAHRQGEKDRLAQLTLWIQNSSDDF